ncbi:MAG: glycerol-3-phosphate 1-O-acyltransferase PlsY [Phycisphaerales bacterium]|nr:MAG: glycerol-3-phosphate 1-O-acyltransferase PlsY [Phycisphaerales bacterium]
MAKPTNLHPDDDMHWITWIVCIAGAYLIGSLPFGVLLARARGIDIRAHGSKNIGATNVARVLGRTWGTICFFLDVMKGAAPVLVAGFVCGVVNRHPNGAEEPLTQTEMWLWLAVAVAVVAGHMFSIFLGFSGGKGVATGFGAMTAMWPLLTIPALGALVVWYAVLRLFRYVSLASMAAVVSLPVGYLLAALPAREVDDLPHHLLRASPPLIVTAVLAIVVVYKHRANITRLRRGEEPKIGGSARRGDVLTDE